MNHSTKTIITIFSSCCILFFPNLFKPKCRIDLNKFTEIVETNNDTFNNVVNGNKLKTYKDLMGNEICYIDYRAHNGQIGRLFVTNNKYKRCNLGTQMVMGAIRDMQKLKTKEIWAVTLENHEYWSNVKIPITINGITEYRKFTKRYPAHSSVTSSGYYMNIE